MKKKFFFATVALVALASCTSDDFIGDAPSPSPNSGPEQAIVFGSGTKAITRADIYGDAAATLLGGNFYVTGTKADMTLDDPVPTNSPTTSLVIDNYLVHYNVNTAGTTESNTANWEYVGVTPDANHVKLSSLNTQTIKYWDYSTDQYDFLAFSTGAFKAVSGTPGTGEIGVTAMKYGDDLASDGTAYTFTIPNIDALKETYISDITRVEKANYGQEVTLKFKNLGSKVRIALYETVPGYSVKNVVFYQVDGTTDFTGTKSTTAALISANTNGIPTKGTIAVYFPHVGSANSSKEDYNEAAATVTPVAASSVKAPTFGDLDNFQGADVDEDDDDYLGRSLPEATFAGDGNKAYYQTVFPVDESSPLTLRVDYTLVSTDGSGETINVYGAKAVVPSTYTTWLPNYAYTYIFKISKNTNGWTDAAATTEGLFPITFDAVVAEATDATGEQKTITTVAAPSITTYQQNHDITKNEYSKATGKNVYVQVMHNTVSPIPHLVGDATYTCEHPKLTDATSLLYEVDDDDATEAEVMDALEKRITDIDDDDVTGRNGITLTKSSKIDNTVEEIVNGPDNNPITVGEGDAAMITITGTGALDAGTYAYVYDYTDGGKTTVTEYQPIAVTTGDAIGTTGEKFASITTTTLDGITTKTAENEAVNNDYIYFSKTKNGSSTTTYSYVSVAGKTTLPAGLIKVAKTSLTLDVDGDTEAVAGTFYFDIYITNNGSYAVKVIKIEA